MNERSEMARALLLVLDSLGIGASADADRFGDVGADTFGHIVEACARGAGDRAGLRAGPLAIPELTRLGLVAAAEASRGARLPLPAAATTGAHGYAVETSRGKDTPSGHWELTGVPVEFPWHTFPPTHPSFPPDLIAALVREAGLPGVLGDCHASGTEIIARLGEEHLRTGAPIVYTSADSVLQIAELHDDLGARRMTVAEHAVGAGGLCDGLQEVGRKALATRLEVAPVEIDRQAAELPMSGHGVLACRPFACRAVATLW